MLKVNQNIQKKASFYYLSVDETCSAQLYVHIEQERNDRNMYCILRPVFINPLLHTLILLSVDY